MSTADAVAARTYGNLIAGEWREAHGEQTFDSLNPARRAEVIGHFARSSASDIELAVQAAVTAQAGWARTPVPARAEILARAGRLLEERKEELARLMTREMGKVLTEARGDVQEGIDMAKYMAGQGRNPIGEVVPSELRQKRAFAERVPIGVVGCITPWNFPMAIPCWKLMPALLAGNAVVFKPAEDTPLVGIKLAEVLIEAGLPPGVLGLVTGFGEEAGAALVEHPGVRAISFTGSVTVGHQIAAICGRLGKRVSLELGGKNAMLVTADANLELALEGAVWGAFGTTGQRCTATSRLIVQEQVLKSFTDLLVSRVAKLRLGDGLDPLTDVGPVINEVQLKRIHGYTAVGQQESARLLTGGKIATAGVLAQGNFYQPTIFGDVSTQMRIAQEEIFGPTAVIIPATDLEDAIRIANGTNYGLSVAIYTRDIDQALQAVDRLEAGIVYVNAPTIGAEIQLPFGGVKWTGNGHRAAGTTALDEFTEWKTVYIDYSGHLQRAQIDTDSG
ncbi:MAG TPA: aldehyde dehydrogenase family protein [Candidatus Dormibacteraeota bacterium]|nr:aldehyde dehydrogenase family protein [Candidatus Dormibacteraeota bacterium]